MKSRKRGGSILAGLLLLCIGSILLLKQFGIPFPAWLFTWPMIVIAFGMLTGAANAFRDPGWVVITGVGAVFLLDKIWPTIPIIHFIWPIVIIALGLIIILAPRRHRAWHDMHREKYGQKNWQDAPIVPDPAISQPAFTPETETEKRSGDNWLDVVTVFGNVKKMVYSKNFKGGDIVSIFGGAEINLSQADFNGTINIELVHIFGGAKLIVPPHWQIHSQNMVAVFGGIEDKRPPQTNYDQNKVVILNGTTFFGGIEIKSY